jgi:hypothetical protein
MRPKFGEEKESFSEQGILSLKLLHEQVVPVPSVVGATVHATKKEGRCAEGFAACDRR